MYNLSLERSTRLLMTEKCFYSSLSKKEQYDYLQKAAEL